MTGRLRILIVDDHPIVRQGLKQTLADATDVGEIGEASNGQGALDLVRESDWDAVVLDIGLPGRGGIEILKDIKRARPHLPVLILSMHPEELHATQVFKAGGSGYLNKESASDELTSAIRKVAKGGRYVSTSLGERLAQELAGDSERPVHERLSDREYQIMWMIASGKTVGEVAEQLFLSPNTVSTYRARILRKMNMKSNAELMHYAIAHHLVD